MISRSMVVLHHPRIWSFSSRFLAITSRKKHNSTPISPGNRSPKRKPRNRNCLFELFPFITTAKATYDDQIKATLLFYILPQTPTPAEQAPNRRCLGLLLLTTPIEARLSLIHSRSNLQEIILVHEKVDGLSANGIGKARPHALSTHH
jgi:hypothetical protein